MWLLVTKYNINTKLNEYYNRFKLILYVNYLIIFNLIKHTKYYIKIYKSWSIINWEFN